MPKGCAVRQQLIGDRAVEETAKALCADPMMEKSGDHATAAVFGMLWTRPGLDLKTRAPICILSDTATHAWPELKIHLPMARNMGWMEDELSGALLHMGGYVGLPSGREALLVEGADARDARGDVAEAPRRR